MNRFEYKGYQGSIKISVEDKCLHGKIEFISDLVTYEGETVEELEKAFYEAVESYLELCKEVGMEPKKPFKGFNVRTGRLHKREGIRIGKELKQKAAIRADEMGKSLEDYVKDAIKNEIKLNA